MLQRWRANVDFLETPSVWGRVMDLAQLLLLALCSFFALNMGGSGIVPSFSAALGAKLVRWRTAFVLFFVFAVLGAVLFGSAVVKTLGSALIPAKTFNVAIALCVIVAATTCMFIANMLKIPESTSWVTVASISTVGLYFGNLKLETLLYRLLPAWVLLPLLGFGLTMLILRQFYPLGARNFRFYEKLLKHESKMRRFVLVSSCCVAVAIGSNNVANVVGPVAALGLVEPWFGLLLAAPMFGFGAFVFRAPIRSVGTEIVPLGPFTASLIKLVFGSLLLCASLLGIPQSSVQLSFACVLAVAVVKDGGAQLAGNRVLRRVIVLWFVNPLIASGVTLLLLLLFGWVGWLPKKV